MTPNFYEDNDFPMNLQLDATRPGTISSAANIQPCLLISAVRNLMQAGSKHENECCMHTCVIRPDAPQSESSEANLHGSLIVPRRTYEMYISIYISERLREGNVFFDIYITMLRT